ncbi:hypothetical protein AB1Y20_001665 [Prymnesium parvum]|uniref:Amidase domain-containing protein n=1 Tax=Prymnesium parvum TaxID=97485 RepID=A0AB34KBI7_PRYPA|mmetsp:Transcript_4905/g.12462  ORF Transcript_4905/g.12462 Transcript_4905/m.12462 type:complete len:480 (+) Transcript_4905:2-1441(+)
MKRPIAMPLSLLHCASGALSARGMHSRPTVLQLADDLAAGRVSSRSLVDEAFANIERPDGEGSRAFMKLYQETARAEADASDQLRRSGVTRSVVEGIPISVKDLFDVAGDVTRAGSRALEHAPAARWDAPAVARLRAAGAVIVGRTTTVEFAFGGLGLNPHYGTPRNPYDRQAARIPGGSSAGAAVAVADGMCAVSIGSDTRGSVRIPSALCGLVGFKPTQARVPRTGVFPLSQTLDSIGPLGNSVACCAIFDSILSGATGSDVVAPAALPAAGLRLCVPRCSVMGSLDPLVASAFARATAALRAAGAAVVEVDAPMMDRAQALFKDGGFAGPEAARVHRQLLKTHAAVYDPRVASRIVLGESFSAVDYIQLFDDRAEVIAQAGALLAPFDAMVYPTTATTAPTISEVDASDAEYAKWNLRLLHNTGLINMLDGCAATVPCHAPEEPPIGISIAGMGGSDARILAVAQTVETVLKDITG